jgi:phage repressor protein C with HTH and peptisase S24 domain
MPSKRTVDPDIASRLRKARASKYETASDAARALGVPVPTYVSHENGNRGIDLGTLHTYASRFRVEIDWLAFGKGSAFNKIEEISGSKTTYANSNIKVDYELDTNFTTFVVVGTVEAGKFFSMDEQSEREYPPETINWEKDHRFPNARHLAFKVRGDSMDLQRICDGDTILAVDWIDTGMQPMTGLTVVVERTLFGGHARELTVKKLEVRPDAYVLHPRSSNPTHKPVVIPRRESEDGDPEFRILALVLGQYGKQEIVQWP